MASSARVVGRVLLAPVWTLVLVLIMLAGAHVFAFDRTRLFLFADAFTLWIYLPAYFVAAGAVCFRHSLLAIAAGVLVVAHLCWIVPPILDRVSVPDAARTAPHLRVVSANLNL